MQTALHRIRVHASYFVQPKTKLLYICKISLELYNVSLGMSVTKRVEIA